MQTGLLLIETTLEQLVVDAIDNLVFQLALVLNLKRLHHVSIGHHSLLASHVGDCDQLKLLLLRGFQWQVLSSVLSVCAHSVVGEKI